jgi:hypothetical protein
VTDEPAPEFAAALVDEATKKSGLVWLTPVRSRRWYEAAERAVAVWLLWHDGAAYVLHGGSEQPAPGLAGAERVAVTVRSKDQGGRLVTWAAAASEVAPGSDGWRAVVPLLLGKRLNLPDGEAAAARWARECTLTKLVPTGELLEAPGSMPEDSQAAPPPDTPATSYVRLPFTVGTATRHPPKPRRVSRRLRRR